ncbi:MAG: hypothetical protein IJ866_01040 [Alphaproteobacteria bacterium]|nr:hypothetical protein [Alphaproteobacteria bacterium]
MFERLKMKMAARRVERNKRARRNRRNRRPSFWARVWSVICWPFRKIWQFICWLWRLICRFIRWLWRVICGINVIGLLNIALLVAIIVLCSMLIIDIVNATRKPVVIVADPVPTSTISKTINVPVIAEPTTKPVSANVARSSVRRPLPKTNTLPIAREKTNRMVAEPIRVVKTTPDIVAEKQTARINNKMYGDVIIDSRGAAKMLNNGSEITGNLYLQNMRKYVLPCDIKVTGNMFVRDVNMLQFCGDFEITGNIYVSPRSSFGPIPRSAHLGGQVIL